MSDAVVLLCVCGAPLVAAVVITIYAACVLAGRMDDVMGQR